MNVVGTTTTAASGSGVVMAWEASRSQVEGVGVPKSATRNCVTGIQTPLRPPYRAAPSYLPRVKDANLFCYFGKGISVTFMLIILF